MRVVFIELKWFLNEIFFVQHLKLVTAEQCGPSRLQPTSTDIKDAVLFFPGKVVTRRLFIQNVKSSMKSTTEMEFNNAVMSLSPTFGSIRKVSVKTKENLVFIKKAPKDLVDFNQISRYTTCFNKEKIYNKGNLTATIFEYLLHENLSANKRLRCDES